VTLRARWVTLRARRVVTARDALATAYLGPPLHADVALRFPADFETELRGAPEHLDLMHIVSGRTMVRASVTL
jgi:hypothetical protein